MNEINDETIDLVVTSPPYPMIAMWDDILSKRNIDVREALDCGNAMEAFELMHRELDKTWKELYRVVKPGGIACINIGDATRTIKGEFRLFPNHARCLNYFLKIGFTNLTNILWRKQTNAPNKFMGSGMLPGGAYVTLEHEYILIFRKGGKRNFASDEQRLSRRQSAFFWEERNTWFSDVWDFKGTAQKLNGRSSRKRSGAYPFEIPYRLINMYSVKGDVVLDPFLGIGTTILASMASCRNSVGYEIDHDLSTEILSTINANTKDGINDYIRGRLSKHVSFIEEKKLKNNESTFKHVNRNYDFPVITGQETDLLINFLESVTQVDDCTLEVNYTTKPTISYFGKDSLFSGMD